MRSNQEELAYLSCLLTLELCIEIHKHKDPNAAARNCCKVLATRMVEHPRVYKVLCGLAKQMLPAVAVHCLVHNLTTAIDGIIKYE